MSEKNQSVTNGELSMYDLVVIDLGNEQIRNKRLKRKIRRQAKRIKVLERSRSDLRANNNKLNKRLIKLHKKIDQLIKELK